MPQADKRAAAPKGDRAERPAPSAAEQARISKAAKRISSREPPPRITSKTERQGNNVTMQVKPAHSDEAGASAHLMDTFGTRSTEAVDTLISQLANAVAPGGEISEAQLNGALATVHGIAPQDEAEAMLAVQMVATHTAALSALQKARTAEYRPGLDSWGNLATKLLRTYTAQLETLAKYRRRGSQTVRVEHVNIAPGGQAIVGPVTHVAGGGGKEKGGDQAHAQEPRPALAHTPVAPLWGSHPVRDAVPLAGREGEEALSDARRREGERRAGG